MIDTALSQIIRSTSVHSLPASINIVCPFLVASPTIGIELVMKGTVRGQGRGIIVLLFVDSPLTHSDKDDNKDIYRS